MAKSKISQSELLERYSRRIATSKKWRKDEGMDDTWRRLSDLYAGKHYDDFAEEDRMVVNVGFSTINVIAPSVAINYPKITVSANKPEEAPNAIIAEAVVNYWMRHYDIKPEFRRSVKDTLIFGHGWVKVGYRFVEEESVSSSSHNSEGEDIDVSDPSPENDEISTSQVIIEDQPFVERVSPFDMFVDPDAVSMKDVRWIAQRIKRPLSEIKSDKRYAKAARDSVQPMVYSKWSDHSATKQINDKSMGYAEIWEFYDLHRNTISVFASDSDQFLIKPTKMPYATGHPFVMLRDYEVPDQFYPMGELEAIEPLQRELNETRSQMLNHRKRFSRKYLFKESAFDNAGRNALESDIDNTMVPVVTDEPLGAVVAPFPAVINPPEFYQQSDLITADIDRISGVTEFMRGGGMAIRRSATEVGAIQDASNARTADKLTMVEVALAEVARRLIALAQQFMSGDQIARITGRDGNNAWVQYDRDYIAGDFDFEVFAGSTQPVNESFRRQSAMQLMDAMAPMASSGIIDMRKLAAHVLQNGFGVKNPEEFMVAEQPPAPEQAQQPQGPPEQPMPPQGPPQEMPQQPMGPEGAPDMGGLPPELMAMLAEQQGGGMPPEGMPMSPEGMPSPDMMGGLVPATGMPAEGGMPDLSQLPPEIIQALLAQLQGGQPPMGGMPPELPPL